MLSALLWGRHGHLALRTNGNGAVFHQRTGSGAQDEGHAERDGRDPSISQGSGLSDGGGDLLLFLPKNRALRHPHKSWAAGYTKERSAEGHPLGHGKEGPAGDSRDRSKKTLVGDERRLLSPRGNVLSSPSGVGLLQQGFVNGRNFGDDPLGALVRPISDGGQAEVPLNGPRTPTKEVKKGGSVAEAIRIAKMGSFQRRVAIFRNRFFAASSARSRASKRAEMIKLARSIKGSNNILPLSKELVESVSAALRESGMKSGPQYLVELKLMHVEAGYEVEAWLKRTFDLCKKALERSRGPTVRAAEVRLALWGAEKLEARSARKGMPETPNLAFAWAAIWMLREIELRKMKISDITFPGPERWVTIWLPTSKMDQQGKGIRRTLRCCGKSPCSMLCPWALGWKAIEVAKDKGALPGSPLFSAWNDLKETSKTNTIKAWRAHLGSDVSGHSARRSGAMYYVRAGLPIQELAFLGRWKSNVVLTYAEEALQERAIFVPELHGNPAPQPADALTVHSQPREDQEESRVAPSTPALTAMRVERPPLEVLPPLSQALRSPRDLWVVTKGRGWKGRPRHLVTKASWNVPMSSWTTSCGWNFAQKSSDFYFVSGSVSDKLKCSKCDTSRSCATSQKGQELRTGFEDDALVGTSTSVPTQARKRRLADRTNSTK